MIVETNDLKNHKKVFQEYSNREIKKDITKTKYLGSIRLDFVRLEKVNYISIHIPFICVNPMSFENKRKKCMDVYRARCTLHCRAVTHTAV